MFCIWERESEHRVRRLESKIYTCKLYCIWFFFLLEYKVGGGRAEQLKAVATQLSRALIAHSRHSKVPAGLASPTAQNLSKYVSGQCATAAAASSCSPTYAARSETPKGDGELLQLPLNRSCHQNMRKISKIPGSWLNAEFCVKPQPIWISIK